MNRKQKLFYAVAGFLIGNIILISMMYGVFYVTDNQSSKNAVSYNEALERVKSSKIKAVNIKEVKDIDSDLLKTDNSGYLTIISEELQNELVKTNASSSPFDRLFQILFILFIISPPLIVVMLFLIWKELKACNKMK